MSDTVIALVLAPFFKILTFGSTLHFLAAQTKGVQPCLSTAFTLFSVTAGITLALLALTALNKILFLSHSFNHFKIIEVHCC
jgi:hypothetical protein